MMEEVGCWVLAGTTSKESRLNPLFPLMKAQGGFWLSSVLDLLIFLSYRRKEYRGFRKLKNLVSGSRSRGGWKSGHMLVSEVAMTDVSTLQHPHKIRDIYICRRCCEGRTLDLRRIPFRNRQNRSTPPLFTPPCQPPEKADATRRAFSSGKPA